MESEKVGQNPVVQKLRGWDSDVVSEVIDFRGETTVVVPARHLIRTCEFLAREGFTYLSDITPVDRFPLEPRFEVNYHLLCLDQKERLRLRVSLSGTEPLIRSVTSIWPTANWHERESFDLFGIRFDGHPDLTRILMPDEWEGHPLRKDYPVEGYR